MMLILKCSNVTVSALFLNWKERASWCPKDLNPKLLLIFIGDFYDKVQSKFYNIC